MLILRKAVLVVFACTFLLILASRPGAKGQEKPGSVPRFAPAEVIATAPVVYPFNAAMPGTVILQVKVDAEGAIGEVSVVRDLPPFTSAALQSIRKWKFKPARLNGRPVGSVVPVVFSFPPVPVG
jgi:TonB family protein